MFNSILQGKDAAQRQAAQVERIWETLAKPGEPLVKTLIPPVSALTQAE